MKTKLMIIILIALFLVACVDGNNGKAETKIPTTLQESGIRRYIDAELGIACYVADKSQVTLVMSCVLIGKAEEMADD